MVQEFGTAVYRYAKKHYPHFRNKFLVMAFLFLAPYRYFAASFGDYCVPQINEVPARPAG